MHERGRCFLTGGRHVIASEVGDKRIVSDGPHSCLMADALLFDSCFIITSF